MEKNNLVLIVEDDEVFAHALADICEHQRCTVFMAFDLKSAWEVISEPGRTLQLIVWDFDLPDGNSLELIGEAKARMPQAIMIASGSDFENRARQIEAGCNSEAGPIQIFDLLREKLSLLPS